MTLSSARVEVVALAVQVVFAEAVALAEANNTARDKIIVSILFIVVLFISCASVSRMQKLHRVMAEGE